MRNHESNDSSATSTDLDDPLKIVAAMDAAHQGLLDWPREAEIEITTHPSLRIEGYPQRSDFPDRSEWTKDRQNLIFLQPKILRYFQVREQGGAL